VRKGFGCMRKLFLGENQRAGLLLALRGVSGVLGNVLDDGLCGFFRWRKGGNENSATKKRVFMEHIRGTCQTPDFVVLIFVLCSQKI
jgi:hypothetical protein